MSSTVRFTPVQSPDSDYVHTRRNAHGAGVKILDLDGLQEELTDTLVDQMDTRDFVDRDEYPGKEYTLLLGFTTWGRDEDEPVGGADYHNLSNTDAEDMARTWAKISQYTEPFVVFQTTFEGSWPEAAELADGDQHIYRVEAADGAVEMEEITVGVTDREVVFTEGHDDE